MQFDLELSLPSDASAPAVARRSVRALSTLISDDLCERVELLVSELVTNSYRHGNIQAAGEITLHLFATREHVRVEVADHGIGFTHASREPTERGSGWGLYLVERLADRWGIKRNGATKVWFEIDDPTGRLHHKQEGQRFDLQPKASSSQAQLARMTLTRPPTDPITR